MKLLFGKNERKDWMFKRYPMLKVWAFCTPLGILIVRWGQP